MYDLQDINNQIDAIDDIMIDYFNRRMKLVQEKAAFKQANALSTFTEPDIKALLLKHFSQVDKPLQEHYVRFYNELLVQAKKYEQHLLGDDNEK